MSNLIEEKDEFRIEEAYDGFRIQKKCNFSFFNVDEEFWEYQKTSADSGRELPEGVRPFKVLSDAKKELERIREFPKYHYL